ncbi:uncharacterized protein LOC125051677 isoform X1 [Pieris napi]|uniref:uncharacterized protein LOC125051677 isoform X1 n=1 Tax=Pieris napi TaxID=78633 RepID=UPI001FBAA9CB|nr:uncharacterized protein LOC125051677 isoform X1 [Pieris napi]
MDSLTSDICELEDCININDFVSKIPSKHLNLLCVHINIRSIIKYFASLEQCIYAANTIDVIVVTEVNISDRISCLYNLNGYQMFSALRNSRKGGGILVYVKKKHKFSIQIVKSQHFENILFTITTQTKYTAHICAIYRPPSLSKSLFIDELHNIIKSNCQKNIDLYLLGDVNINLKLDIPIKHKYCNTLHSLGLMCGITTYTRAELYKGIVTKSCIDHIYARSQTHDLYTAAVGTKLADHRAIVLACTKAQLQDVPTYKTLIDKNKLTTLLEQIDWKPTVEMTCPIGIYNFIQNNITQAYKKSEYTVKLKSNTHRNSNHWINNRIIIACHYRDKLFTQYIKDTNNLILKQKYNKTRNYVNKLINKTKNKTLRTNIEANKNNLKNLWDILNQLTGKIKTSIDVAIQNSFENQNVTCKDIANNFATTFHNSISNVATNCAIPLLDTSLYRRAENTSMRFQSADPKSIAKIIKSLNDKKSPGADRIRTIDIKMLCNKINVAIANLINTSIYTGQYPNLLKTGIVRPIYKNGSKKNYNNYRPITILPTINKIIEKYICGQIQSYYKKHNILSNKQYGFQPNKNTTQLLSAFTDLIYKHLNKKDHVLVVFIDYSKAFDTLRHSVILQNLNDCGVRGNLLKWCENYLQDRTYRVKVCNEESFPISITEDDTCLVAAGANIQEAETKLQADFDALAEWSHDVGLVLNPGKTKFMHIRSSRNLGARAPHLVLHNHICAHSSKSYPINCNCNALELVHGHRYLGLVIDDRMSWKMHINSVCERLRAILAKFTIIKNKIPLNTLLLLYKALAESIITYGLSSYGRTCKTYLNQIFSLQIRILKAIAPYKIKSQYKEDYRKLFAFFKIIPIQEKVQLALLNENYFTDNYLKTTKTHYHYTTRRKLKNDFLLPKYNNLYGKKTLDYIIPNLLNSLPAALFANVTGNNIKFKLKNYFISQTITNYA